MLAAMHTAEPRPLARLPKEPRLTVRLAESYLQLARVPRAIALENSINEAFDSKI